MLCNICNDDVFDEDEIKCSSCNGFHHFGCVALRETAFRKMSKSAKKNWCCIKCKNAVNNSISETPIITRADIKVDQLLTNESFKNLVDSVNFMSDKFDTFGSQIQELVISINTMREENRILKEQNNNLRNDINFLQKRMNNLEQKTLDNFVEIIGVPEISNENCKKTVEKIATSLKLKIEVVNAFRVHSKIKTRPSKIVAELTMKQNKKEMIELSRKTKLTGSNVDADWKNNAIYVNDNLTQFNRNLFFKTKTFARESGYRYVWFKDTKLFIKKNDNSKAFLVDSELSLTKLT
ncbi:uncharacterized protein LOC112595249 [Melanaphis sacchari]|uniref:uncharacterized protein LOC112595249 n=1 Tax=Melanaphis sacchari TaxID=742174 RepID=UPI000DC13F17|nr:uncharacterized protein LOC112595249 [Melanaphis sacchari]